jgi:hypothetical protein
MRYRRIIDGEPCFGQGRNDFLTDNDAVAQAILTRLKLFSGEWWENLNEGLPLWTQMIGYSGTNKAHVDATIKKRIEDTKLNGQSLIVNVSNVAGVYTPATRSYSFSADVQTIYGTVQVTSAR